MSREGHPQGISYSGYQAVIFWSYSDLQDYLWKSPQFIETEINAERKKLDAYFPRSGTREERERNEELRRIRAHLEGRKLFGAFPSLIAQSNLFLAASWFEQHLLKLSKYREADCGVAVAKTQGNGVSRYLSYLAATGTPTHKINCYERVLIAITLRNALLHAAGDLTISRDSVRVRQIIKSATHIEKERRGNGLGTVDDLGRPEASIKDDQLVINHYYPMRATRDFFGFLIGASEGIPSALA